ncbi:ATP-binding protein [Streptomyces sp. NPDC057257]|uniref:ATP-binding protein n=1 Tax=Streptomyces sp. NPDC057257 TaxID=3346071 RepID=UPI003635FD00
MLRRDAFRLPRHPTSVACARRRVRHHLTAWGHKPDDEVTEEVVLLVSELAANVVRHAPAQAQEFEIAVTALADDSCFIEVSDESPALPSLRAVSCWEEESGRGLRLVDELARTWGVHQRGGHGKTVWALITSGPP